MSIILFKDMEMNGVYDTKVIVNTITEKNTAGGKPMLRIMISDGTENVSAVMFDTTKKNLTDTGITDGMPAETKIHIAEGGMLNGDAKATDILVDGEVDGKIVISNIAEISDTGSMQGALEVKTLVTNPGSHFDGRLSIVPERMKPHVDISEDSSAIEY